MTRFALAVLGLCAVFAASAVEIGQVAPETRGERLLYDQTLDLAELRGKTVLLDFWASWCAPCRQSFPFMQSLQQRYGAQGLRVVAVSLDARAEDAQRFLDQRQPDFALWHDPQARLVVDYPVQVMPTSFLLDAQGRVLHRHSGFRAADAAPLEARIRYYLATGTAPAAAGAQASAPVPAQASEERRR